MILEEVKIHIDNIRDGKSLVDISKFDDPFAEKVRWDPVIRGGVNRNTHTLKKAGWKRLEFKTTFQYAINSLWILFIGIALCVTILIPEENVSIKELLFTLFLGLILIFLGKHFVKDAFQPIVFDFNKNYFWKGNITPDTPEKRAIISTYCVLDDIYALQLIAENSSSQKAPYTYELNLVLNSGDRINVLNHCNKKQIFKDALLLSRSLKVPAWNGCHDKESIFL